MALFVEKSGRSRLWAGLALACASAALAGCSETAGTVKPTAAVTTTNRTALVDPGQPIVLSGGSLASAEAPTGTAPSAAPSQPMAPATTATIAPADTPRMATAMVDPSAGDLAEPVAQPEVTALPDPGAPPADTGANTGGPFVEPPAAEVLSDGPTRSQEISASAKAQLIGELQALKKRPGVAPAAAAASDDCPEGSLEPQCLAAAD